LCPGDCRRCERESERGQGERETHRQDQLANEKGTTGNAAW